MTLKQWEHLQRVAESTTTAYPEASAVVMGCPAHYFLQGHCVHCNAEQEPA